MNFKDFRKRLNELKNLEHKLAFDYLLANLGTDEEKDCLSALKKIRCDLEQFRNTINPDVECVK